MPTNAPHIARRELRQFLQMADQIGIDTDGLCRRLRLSRDDWQRWQGVLHDEPLPSYPELPLMLRHLGYLTNRLDRVRRTEFA